MREIRPSGSEGGVARLRHPYPYQTLSRNPNDPKLRQSEGASERTSVGRQDG